MEVLLMHQQQWQEVSMLLLMHQQQWQEVSMLLLMHQQQWQMDGGAVVDNLHFSCLCFQVCISTVIFYFTRHGVPWCAL